MEMLQKEGFLQENLLGTLRSKRSFRTFIYAIDKAGLTESFNGADQYTLFAPTDEAFRQLPHGTLEQLIDPANREKLAAMVNYHVVLGRKTIMDVGEWEAAPTLQGQAAPIAIVGSQLSIDGAQITRPDIMARNGVIHGIDKVNIPEPPPR